MNNKSLAGLIRPFAEKKLWVALDEKETQVMGTGKTPREAMDKARLKGVNVPSIIQARSDYGSLIPAC